MRPYVAMLTCDRPQGYVHQSIEGLRETGFFDQHHLNLFVGDPSTDYLARYRDDPAITIIPLDPGEQKWLGWDRLYSKSKCSYGHAVILRTAAVDQGWDTLIVLEDDVIVAEGWLDYLEAYLPLIRRAHGEEWMLAIYQHSGVRGHEAERWYYAIKDPYYDGGIAEVYTRASISGLADCLITRSVHEFQLPNDWLTGEYFKEKGWALLATAPCLVEHIGRIGTGQSFNYHRADWFVPWVGRFLP